MPTTGALAGANSSPISTSLLTRRLFNKRRPQFGAESNFLAGRRGKRDQRELDNADGRILRALQHDAYLTLTHIAERVGLSQTPSWNRLKRLENTGVVDGYVAVLSNEKLGYPETIIIEVPLDRHEEDLLERFGEPLKNLPEVIEAYLTAGGYDCLIKVAVAGQRDLSSSFVKSFIA